MPLANRIVHPILKAKKWTGQPWEYAQVKLDGFRITGYIDKNHTILLYGKNHRADLELGARFPRLLKTSFYESLLRMPADSSVDGEILVPGGTSSDVPTALRDPKVPIKITVFAIPRYRGFPRAAYGLVWVEDIARQYGFEMASWFNKDILSKVLHFDFERSINNTSLQEMKDKLLRYSKKLGYEGWVLKQFQYKGWYKVKEVQTVDCVITDWIPGKGKFKGLIGALEVSLYKSGKLIPIAHAAGMNDKLRKTLTKMAEDTSLIGLVVEVKYQQIGSKGGLRHPRFLRLRPDKPKKECVWSQLIDNC